MTLRIPPGELRGIGLQMGKREKVGEIKMEMGQRKLDFRKVPKAEARVGPLRLQALTSPPPQQNTPPVYPQTPVKLTQFIAPTQIDPESPGQPSRRHLRTNHLTQTGLESNR